MAKCCDCGYLGVFHPNTNELIEADFHLRREGWAGIDGQRCTPRIVCFKNIRTLHESNWNRRGQMLPVIQEEIECGKFVPYAPGRTPKDLEQMTSENAILDIKKAMLDLQTQTFELHQRQEKSELEQAKLEDKRNEKNDQFQNRMNWRMFWLGVFTLVVTIAGVVATIIVGMWQNGP